MAHDEAQAQSFDPGLRLRAMRVLDDNTIEVEFEGIGVASDERFLASRSQAGDIEVWNLEDRFARRYRSMPGVYAGEGLERLAGLFLKVRDSELPVGESLERAEAANRAALAEGWQSQEAGRASDATP